jgi:uncharacterized protein YcbK (DUF882 family)
MSNKVKYIIKKKMFVFLLVFFLFFTEALGGGKGVYHTLERGETLWHIAKTYGVSIKLLKKVNKLKNPDMIRAGARIFVPEAKKILKIKIKRRRCVRQRPVTFVRVQTNEEIRVRLLKCNGRISPFARRKLSYLMRPRKKGKRRLVHPRLIRYLFKFARKWPGKRIKIYSGYRPTKKKRKRSYHAKARAIDFSIEGVSKLALYKFCRKLKRAGCGYYPNSVFIHMDVRKTKGRWIDYSYPGQRPKYGPSHSKEKRQERGADEP